MEGKWSVAAMKDTEEAGIIYTLVRDIFHFSYKTSAVPDQGTGWGVSIEVGTSFYEND